MKKLPTIAMLSAMALLAAAPAFAQTDAAAPAPTAAPAVTTSVKADKAQTRLTNAKEKADQEIERRINALNDLGAKVQAMSKVTESAKSAVATMVGNEIASLTSLRTKVASETDITALKADIKSIADSYRVFMLVIPQSRIQIAADKIATVTSSLSALSSKLQTRITDAQSAGKDVSAVSKSLADLNDKVTDANTQIAAAVSSTASLVPDGGDKTKAAANTSALKEARTKIQAANKDIDAARADAKNIVQGLKALNASSSTSATTATTSTQ